MYDLSTISISKAANGYIVDLPKPELDPMKQMKEFALTVGKSMKEAEMDEVERLISSGTELGEIETSNLPSTHIFKTFDEVLTFLSEQKF